MGHMGQRVAGQLSRGFGPVDRLPVHRAGGMLHQEPGFPMRHPGGQRRREAQLVPRAAHRLAVVVVGDEVHFLSPVGVVGESGIAHDHEVGGDRDVGGDAAQHLALGNQVPL
ncbi:hypothetical protein D3C74_454030 [compost metagenome]